MKRHRNVLWAVTAALAAAAIAAPTSGANAPRAGVAAGCTPATNIEAIIDDSGSMAVTDSEPLRVQGMNLLINTLSPSTTLGAVEFGGNFFTRHALRRHRVPARSRSGANAAAMKAALEPRSKPTTAARTTTRHSHGRAANPGAQARIFLTDGGHDIGTYNNTHLTRPQARRRT